MTEEYGKLPFSFIVISQRNADLQRPTISTAEPSLHINTTLDELRTGLSRLKATQSHCFTLKAFFCAKYSGALLYGFSMTGMLAGSFSTWVWLEHLYYGLCRSLPFYPSTSHSWSDFHHKQILSQGFTLASTLKPTGQDNRKSKVWFETDIEKQS